MRLRQNLLPNRKQCMKFRNNCAIYHKRIKLSETERLCYSVCTTLTQNKIMYHCVMQLKDHHIVDPAGPKSKQRKKFTHEWVGFNFAAFLGSIYLADSCHGEINWSVRGTMRVGRIFSQGIPKRIFPGIAEKIYPGEKQLNSILPTRKKTTFFIKTLIRKCQILNSRRAQPRLTLAPFPTPMRGICCNFQLTKTSGIHKIRFLEI